MKKYKLLRFLNKKHNFIVLILFGIFGFLGTAVVSRSQKLARESYRNFTVGDFKIASRRAGWMLRRFWGIRLVEDEIYNFTEHLTEEELQILDVKIRNMSLKNSKSLRLKSDQLYILAALMEINPNNYAMLKCEFEALASDICELRSKRLSTKVEPGNLERKADFDIYQARQALSDFAKEFPIESLEWYIISGTFLGLIREGGFLSHDYDIDFGVHAETFQSETFIESIKSSKKFSLRKVDNQKHFELHQDRLEYVDEKITLIKIIHETQLNVDIFVHYLEDGVRWHGSSFHRWDNKEFVLNRYQFEGVEVNAPADSDLYLTENYGDWKTPVTEFNCSTGTPNLVLVRNLSSIGLFLRRIAISNNEKDFEKNVSILTNANLLKRNQELKQFVFNIA
jgi:hypothetical protein